MNATKCFEMEHKVIRKIDLKLRYAFFLLLINLWIIPNAMSKEKIAVIDLEAQYGVDVNLSKAISVEIRDAIHNFGEFEVLSKDDLEVIAQRVKIQQDLGCEDTLCLINIGRSIGTRFIIAGSVSKLGHVFSIHLRLIDTEGENPGVIKRSNKKCECNESGLFKVAQEISAIIMGKEIPDIKVSDSSSSTQKMFKDKSEENRNGLKIRMAIFPLNKRKGDSRYNQDWMDCIEKKVKSFSTYDIAYTFNNTEAIIKSINSNEISYDLLNNLWIEGDQTPYMEPNISLVCGVGGSLKVDVCLLFYYSPTFTLVGYLVDVQTREMLFKIEDGGERGAGSSEVVYILNSLLPQYLEIKKTREFFEKTQRERQLQQSENSTKKKPGDKITLAILPFRFSDPYGSRSSKETTIEGIKEALEKSTQFDLTYSNYKITSFNNTKLLPEPITNQRNLWVVKEDGSTPRPSEYELLNIGKTLEVDVILVIYINEFHHKLYGYIFNAITNHMHSASEGLTSHSGSSRWLVQKLLKKYNLKNGSSD